MLFKHIGFYVIKIRYALISISIVLLAVLLMMFFYLTALIDTRTVSAMAESIQTKVIVIDPGHGGYDPGAIGALGTREKDITLQVSERLARRLSRDGALVVLIRKGDEDFVTPGPGTSKKRDLDARLEIIEQKNPEIVISIHVNSFGSQWSGAQTFFQPNSEQGAELARLIQDELKAATNTNREAITINTSYLLNNINVPGCIVELGFLSNPQEEKRLIDPAYQERLAEAIYRGILRYMAGRKFHAE